MAKKNIYGSKSNYTKELKRIHEAPISQQNKDFINEFLDYLLANNISETRAIKLGSELRNLAKWFNIDFDVATRKDVEKVVRFVNLKEDYTAETKKDYRRVIKQFWKWLKQTGSSFPPEVDWIKTAYNKSHNRLVNDILTPQDIRKVLSFVTSKRDKALISFLYESGARIGEVLSMEIKDFWMERVCAKVRLVGKTGERIIPIVNSVPYLSKYLDDHPFRDEPHASFWLAIGTFHKNKDLEYQGASKRIARLFVKAGIKKRCNPHAFRHSRASELSLALTEAQMCAYFGWVIGSDQTRTYVHISGRDLDAGILKYNGIKVEEEDKPHPLAIQKCARCSFENGATAKYCAQCSMALTYASALEAEKILNAATDEAMGYLMNISKDPALLTEFNEFRLKQKSDL